MSPRPGSDGERGRAVRRVLWLTLGLNLGVACAKIAYGALSGSLSIRADGFHSLTDSSNNLVGLVGLFLASRPADAGHPYGHHKFEVIAAGLLGLSLLGMAIDVVRSGFVRLSSGMVHGPTLDSGAFVVLGVTLLVNVGVSRYERKRGEELDSPFLVGDAAHTRSDVLVTLGVLVSTLIVRAGYPVVDIIGAILVAIFIAWAGISVLRENLGYLADAVRIEPALLERVACGVPGVASAHKIRTRGMPGSIYVDLHIQVAPTLTVVEAHRVTHWVIDAIKGEFPGVRDVLVHTEPARPDQSYAPLPTGAGDDGAGDHGAG